MKVRDVPFHLPYGRLICSYRFQSDRPKCKGRLADLFYREIPKNSRSSSHFFLRPFLSWCHREEVEGGEGERGGATLRRKRERGRGVVPP